jgi:hypothetical protein
MGSLSLKYEFKTWLADIHSANYLNILQFLAHYEVGSFTNLLLIQEFI